MKKIILLIAFLFLLFYSFPSSAAYTQPEGQLHCGNSKGQYIYITPNSGYYAFALINNYGDGWNAALYNNGNVIQASSSSFTRYCSGYVTWGGSPMAITSRIEVSKPYDSNIPMFRSISDAISFFRDGVVPDNAFIPIPPIDYDPLNYEYDSRVPTPVITYNSKLDSFTFQNGAEGLGVVAYSRWLSVQDINLNFDDSNQLNHVLDFGNSFLSGDYSGNFASFSSVVSSSFEESITVQDNVSSLDAVRLYGTLGGSSPFIDHFNDLIAVYPPANRNIDSQHRSNPLLGTDYSWFVNASSSLRGSLASPRNSLSAPEIYFRYYTYLDDTLVFSRWTKFTLSLSMDKYTKDFTIYPDLNYGTDNAPTNYYTGVSDSNDPITVDKPLAPSSNLNNTVTVNTQNQTVDINLNSVDWSTYINTFRNSLGLFGNFSAFVSTVFSFMPAWFIVLMGSTVTMLCGLAIYHGIRG